MHIDYRIKQGDTHPEIEVTAVDEDGNAIDLSAATSAAFHMFKQGASVAVLNATAAIDPDQTANKGKMTYDWQSGDTDDFGLFFAEFEVTWNNGEVTTFPRGGYVVIRIERQLA